MVIGYAVAGISEKVPSVMEYPTILPAASKIEAAATGMLSNASVIRPWEKAERENRRLMSKYLNLFIEFVE
jgi:hypothetical protein